MTQTEKRRVVVTGTGAICAVGNTVPQIWDAVVAGKSGIAPMTRFDATGYSTTFAGEVKGFDAAAELGKKEIRRMDRFTQLAIVATREAMSQSGLNVAADATRVGVLIGTAMGGIETFELGTETVLQKGPTRLTPFFIPMMLANMASGNVSIEIGAKGPNFATVSACAASAHSIGEGVLMIRDGRADVIVAGGTEAPVTRMGVAGFNSMTALSKRNDAPEEASRPFDAGRDGFVLAEGAAVLVLEERQRALARGATILAEITGYATTDDANHMVQPGPEGEGAARAMTLALADANLQPSDIDYINAHGTSTQLNEKMETMAFKTALGEHAWSVAISSTKSMTGHLLGAAGALEAVLSIEAIRHDLAPPTINQTTPDPDCDLDYVPNQSRSIPIRHALSNSMGFGGHNAILILSEHEA